MQAFLNKCVENIFDKYPEKVSDLCIVLPNRRAQLFLKKHMAAKLEKPIIMPEIFSIEDFVAELSGRNIMDNLNLIFELYEIHKNIESSNAQEFEKFADWGFSLLRDFNEIDQYLIDPEKLFDFVSEARAVELWNPGESSPSEFQKKYIRFYRSLIEYYRQLNTRLSSTQTAYIGQAYRLVAETDAGNEKVANWEKIIFIGFNALTLSEKKIIQKLMKEDKAEILWDADHYYLEHEFNGIKQEAGFFLRKLFNERSFEKPDWIFNNFKEEQKNINIIGVPQNVGQAKLCGKILKEEIPAEELHSKTAVVMAGESMLIPLLNSLPEEVERFNITMGFPLNQTPLNNLFQLLTNANLNLMRYEEIYSKETGFYMKDVFSILRNPVIAGNSAELFGLKKDDFHNRILELAQTNKIFFTSAELKSFLKSEANKFPDVLFSSWKDQTEIALEALVQLIQLLKEAYAGKGAEENNYRYEIETEQLFHFAGIIKRIKEINLKYKAITNLKTLQGLFRQIVKQSSLPFYGEPLSGLQVMGMLETRTLDFENVILLSANEGILPAAKTDVSFIPFDIKRQFGLPTYREREAVFAYHFYRLLQRSKNVYILYNTEPGQMGGGDKSRFINQLINELNRYNDKIKIEEQIFSNTVSTGKQEAEISIPKSAEVMDLLSSKAQSGFSASSLNTYRNCPLQFYLNTVLGIEEEQETEEVIGSSTMGTIIHKILHELYKEYRNKPMTVEDLDQMKNQIRNLTESVISEEFKGGEIRYGKNYLLVNVIEELIKNHLKQQKEHLAELKKQNRFLTVAELEKKIKVPFDADVNNSGTEINLKGFIDRIDKTDGQVHILDYKTGYLQGRDTSLNSIADFEENSSDKSFQLLFYSWLYKQAEPQAADKLMAGIIPLRRTTQLKQFLTVNKSLDISSEVLDEFSSYLQQLLEEIFDPDYIFSQTPVRENCSYCEFKSICRR